jgi:hypothetical protein
LARRNADSEGPEGLSDRARRRYTVYVITSLPTVEDITGALHQAELPAGVRAYEFRLDWHEELDQPVARIIMILQGDEWTEAANQACLSASSAAWSALAPLGVFADVICRTETEHRQLRTEGDWHQLVTNGHS